MIELRTAHPAWGGRKIRARMIALGHPVVPQPSTITAILARHQLIEPSESAKRQPFCRFEHPRPNDLWQMDFKGDFALDDGRCFPLTVLDDHSRFALGLAGLSRTIDYSDTNCAASSVPSLWIACENDDGQWFSLGFIQ